MTEYHSIGKLVAAFGVNGELVLRHGLGKRTALKGLECLFIEQKKEELLPYFIEAVRVKSDDEVYIRLEGVSTREAARNLLQKQVWFREDAFRRYAGRSAPLSLLGFHIVHGGEDLGEILEVIEQPHQVLCRIAPEGKEMLIPLHAGTLRKVDKKHRKVIVELPEGLLEIFR